jgi:predicted nucleic acid-binding protein
VSETPLAYIRQAIAGEIDAVVPYPAVIGSHVVLAKYYGFSNENASRLMQNFMDANRIHWYAELSEELIRGGLQQASDLNINGWDGYYAEVARTEGVETILTIDDDFEQVTGVNAEVVLTPDEFETLTEYLTT